MALEDVERGLVARYLARVLERGDLPLRATRYILYWLNDRAELLGLPIPKDLSANIGNVYASGVSISDFERAFTQHRDDVVSGLRKAAEETSTPEPLATNIERLVDELRLPKAAAKIVGLIACYSRYEQVEYLCNAVSESCGPLPRVVSLLVGEPARNVEQLLAPSGDLIAAGLLQLRDGNMELAGPSGHFAIPKRVDICIDRVFDSFAHMREELLGEPMKAGISLADYDHVSTDCELITKVLEGASKEKAKGVNILLYGPPGSGKTELTKVVSEAAGLTVYGAGEDLEMTGETDRSTRLSDLVFALRLVSGSERTAILFDEMEDVAWQLINRGGSKLYLNRLLETNPVPILWTSNNISDIDPALLRRMTLAVELKLPPVSQRSRILRKISDRAGVELSDEEVERLARRLDATPAVLENAVRAAKYSGGGGEALERAALGIIRAVSGVGAKRDIIIPDFDPELSRASLDLTDLTEQLIGANAKAFSLCLSGPPGTGKSAYARHVAKKLDLEVLQKRASDLLGAFVGESEKRIAEAFEEAREAKALLIFDEADSLLFDRGQAVRSWEVTQVNEMLTWMEEHPYPVCFTTNLMDRMDNASRRRFTFHIVFEYLDDIGLERAYKVFFGMDTVPSGGLRYDNLTPGDFAQARKQAKVLNLLGQHEKIVLLLSDISKQKPGRTEPIGFL